jgi:DMSO/TMAO reductase YedYZ molybdopterin-dependent catalytic subunit
MLRNERFDRRRFLQGAALGGSSLLLGGCNELSQVAWFRRFLSSAENATRASQRALLAKQALAPEYSEADLSTEFRANGSTAPEDPDYQALAADGFRDWKLAVGGLVEQPASFTLADLRAFPARTQITRHVCVVGWSCIGKWTGGPLGLVLDKVKLKPEAKYLVFFCADDLEETLDGSGKYYESIGLEDAFHPQTILAYDMNGQALPIPHGAPIRLRVERQLGYKMAKYVMRIEAVDDLSRFGDGQGGFWEDRGYEWYAGI